MQLLLLQAGDAQKSSPHQPRFLPLALIAISPLLQSAFQGAFFVPEEPPGSPRKELPDQAIPESVQILPVESQPADVQVSLYARCERSNAAVPATLLQAVHVFCSCDCTHPERVIRINALPWLLAHGMLTLKSAADTMKSVAL